MTDKNFHGNKNIAQLACRKQIILYSKIGENVNDEIRLNETYN